MRAFNISAKRESTGGEVFLSLLRDLTEFFIMNCCYTDKQLLHHITVWNWPFWTAYIFFKAGGDLS